MYCEMLPELCKAAQYNYAVLKTDNITVRNAAVTTEKENPLKNDCLSNLGQKHKSPNDTSIFQTPTQILKDFQPDIVYMDPARRGEGGKKVFLIEDCTPDVLTLKDEIFQHTRHILLKLSPMADITMVCERLGRCCREVHVVAAGGECKELLVWMDREWDNEYMIHAVELHKDGGPGVFTFTVSEEKNAAKAYTDGTAFLFEPGKSLMKAGAFNLISERFEISTKARTRYSILASQKYFGNKGNRLLIFRGGYSIIKIIKCKRRFRYESNQNGIYMQRMRIQKS
jgi:hypothetical protein